MRVYNNRVYCSKDDVRDFMSNFPCSGLDGTRLWFEFDSSYNLVDMGPGDTASQDGYGLLCLSQDAEKYLRSKRK